MAGTVKPLAPGSDEAVKAGCLCPQLDNGYGRGAYTDKNGDPVFWFSFDCPLHGKSKQIDENTELFKEA